MVNDRQAFPEAREFADVIRFIADEATAYLEKLPERAVRSPGAVEGLRRFDEPLPEMGHGASDTLRTLVREGLGSAVSTGPRFFHFVMGGATPAAFGADWLTTVIDQVAYAWVSSPLAIQLEIISLGWLRDLFALPAQWSGIMTTGATMSNFVCLAAARQWWGDQHGADVSESGLSGLPVPPVFSGGHIHASSIKALSMLGMGRASARLLTRDNKGRLDIGALEKALVAQDGAPSIIVANAGEVNAGEFDPIDALADLAKQHNAWLHIDGAFGLFAALSPRTQHLVKGADRANSVTVDGHKWLNVPYDCGFAFVEDGTLLARTFRYTAAYLPKPDDPNPTLGAIGPESSRRARALAVWATLHAYGRRGYREIVERHLDLAKRLGELVREAPDLELLADVQLNIVCFRYNPGGLSEEALNAINERLGEAILEDGRVYVGTTRFGDQVALRPAIVNWRSTEGDIQLLVNVIRELAPRVAGERG